MIFIKISFKLFIILLLIEGCSSRPVLFIQMTDPQMGMFSEDKNMTYEIDHLNNAINGINAIKPDFVVVCGDLTDMEGNNEQISEYFRTMSQIDPSIKIYNVAGNHDVGDIPDIESLELYHSHFGKDHYSFKKGDVYGIVLNSSVMRQDSLVKEIALEQNLWLQKTLKKANRSGKTILIFMHHPLFHALPGEKTGYENFPEPERSEYLALFKKYNVTAIFSGHLHRNRILDLGGLQQITIAAITTNFKRDSSGIRIIRVDDGKLEHRYLVLDSISNEQSKQTVRIRN